MDSLINVIVFAVIGATFVFVLARYLKESSETEQVKRRVERIGQIKKQLQADKQTTAQKVSEYEQAKADYLNNRDNK